MGFIYMIRNQITGKVYIGQTKQPLEKRWMAHRYELRNGTKRNAKFQNAWNKYGEQSFDFIEIARCQNADLDDLEIAYINKYDSLKNGYNATAGGKQVMRGQKHSSNVRNKMSASLKAAWKRPAVRANFLKRPIYSGSLSPRAKKVICINDQTVFGSAVEAGSFYGVDHKIVSACCTGTQAYTMAESKRKLEFAYFVDGKTYGLAGTTYQNEKHAVRCVTTGETFESAREAHFRTGTSAASIAHVCKGSRKHAGKLNGVPLEWEYAF